MLRGVIEVTCAALHAVNSMLEVEADEFTLHDETSKFWPTQEAGVLEGAVWRPDKSA